MRRISTTIALLCLSTALPSSGSAADLTPAELKPDCGYVFNLATSNPPGFDSMAAGLMVLLTMPGIFDTPVSSWDTADLEWIDGVYYGDDIPDCYQWAMLGAVLCAGDPLVTSQFNVNKQEVDDMVAQLSEIGTAFIPIKAVIESTASSIETWAMGLEDQALAYEAMDLSYLLSDTAYALNNDVGAYLPIVTSVLPLYSAWFAGLGGLSTPAQDSAYYAFDSLLNNFLSTASCKPITISRLTIERDGLLDFAVLSQPPMTADLAAKCTTLANLLDAALAKIVPLERPDLVVFGVDGKAAGEPFSAEGDYNGDGVTNKDTYDLVSAAGGDRFDYVTAAASDNPFWQGNPALPVASATGLVITASLLAFTALRKRF